MFPRIFQLSLLVLLTGSQLFAAPLNPDVLTCESRVNPLGIDSRLPRFAWTFVAAGRNQFQESYAIIVSENLEEIRNGKGTTWSSGWVTSSKNIQIPYGGAALRSFKRYYWRVRITDKQKNKSGWSQINWFETAMLDQSDWTASWIGDGRPGPLTPEDHFQPDPMPLFRKQFNVQGKITAARLYISGMGYYEAFINGKKVSDNMLDPGWTAYGKQVSYVIHDITKLLKTGDNVTGIMLGNGWWNPSSFKLFGRFDLRDYQQTGRPCVRAELHIKYANGKTAIIKTDEQWMTAPGPVLRNNVYLGEHYDARKELPSWMGAKKSNENWKAAVRVVGPAGKLTAQALPPIRVTREVKPLRIFQVSKDTFIADMGQNFAGVARIKIKGNAGTRITLRYGEGIFKDSSLNVMTTAATQIKKGGIKGGPGAPPTAWQEDSYTLKGGGLEVWSPRFTFHGFRYVEITGWPGKPSINDITGLRMNSDLEQTGEFTCFNEMFNQLHDIIQWTFLSNVFSVQSDCPGREKMGYGADMVVSAEAFLYNYDMSQFYAKSVRDFANDQRPLGGMTEIAPSTGINERGYGDSTGPLGWQLAFPFLQKKLYEFYGDERIIAEQYPALKRQISFLESRAENNLFKWDIGDHEALDPKADALSASLFYLQHVQIAAEFAGILGKNEDQSGYLKLATNIQTSIVEHFLAVGTGKFDNGTQAAQLFALWYGVSPEKDLTMQGLLKEIERHKHHLSTGIFSTKMFFDVMRETGQNEIAYRVANQLDYPGWGYMLESGASTLWETWSFPETGPSRNHPMFGSIDEWFYRSLLGINAAGAGFSRMIIKPQPAGDLKFAKGSYKSVRGLISVNWLKMDNYFNLLVTIPPNTTAEVWIPAKEGAVVTEADKPTKVNRYEKGYAVMEVGSGDYSFSVEE